MIKEFAKNYLADLNKIAGSISLENLERIVDIILNIYNNENSIFIMGNGGSASTASHFACDINKGVCFGLKKKFKVICLNDNIPTMCAYANDNSYNDVFVEQLKNFLRLNDVVIGISGSGNSTNVIKAIQYANDNGATSIALAGFDGGQLAKTAKTSIVIPVNNMQKVEDMHLIIIHIIMQILYKIVRSE